MKRIAQFSTVFLVICCSFCQQGYCVWNRVAQFPKEIAVSGFFWDEFNGFVGFGSNRATIATTARIRRTQDGGKTWTLSITPNTQGAVTSIFMKDNLVGYASIFETGRWTNYSIWKTIDGGKTWADDSHGNSAHTNCIYATSKTLIRTTWDNNDIGGVSTNDGNTFSSIFTTQNSDRSNGIDFVDDTIDVRRPSDAGATGKNEGGRNRSDQGRQSVHQLIHCGTVARVATARRELARLPTQSLRPRRLLRRS